MPEAHANPEVLVSHANARTTLAGRLLFVRRHQAGTGTGDSFESAAAGAPSVGNNSFAYLSGHHDRASGLVKFGTRYYIPRLATWPSLIR